MNPSYPFYNLIDQQPVSTTSSLNSTNFLIQTHPVNYFPRSANSNSLIQNVVPSQNYSGQNHTIYDEQNAFQNLLKFQVPNYHNAFSQFSVPNSQDVRPTNIQPYNSNGNYSADFYQTMGPVTAQNGNTQPLINNLPPLFSNLLPYNNNSNDCYSYSNNSSIPFENHIKTIVFPNDEEIQDVIMGEDNCDISDESPYDPNEQESLLDIDYNLTKTKNTILNMNKENETERNDVDFFEKEYWNKTQDCDYRVNKANSSSAKLNRTLSRKKYNKFKRKRKSLDLLMVKSIHENTSDVDDDLENIDNLPYEDLISFYNKLKEELTILSCEQNASDKIDFELSKAKRNASKNDSIPISNKSDSAPIITNLEAESVKPGVCNTTLDPISDDELERTIAAACSTISEKIAMDSPVDYEQQISDTIPSDNQTKFLLDNLDEDDDSSDDDVSKTSNDLLNENILREQLIRNLLEKRLTQSNDSSVTKSEDNPVETVETINSQIELKSKLVSSNTIQQNENKSLLNVCRPDSKPKIDSDKYRLVIEFSNSDSDESDNDVDDGSKNSLPAIVPQSNAIKSSRMITSKHVKNNASIHKLSTSQQEEYLKLTKEIQRRELGKKESGGFDSISLDNLKKYEMKIKELALGTRLKKSRISCLNSRMLDYKKKFKKAKHRALRLHRMYLIATKNIKLYSVQMQMALKEATAVQQSLNAESLELGRYRQICKAIGTRLVGSNYNPPSIQVQTTRPVNTMAWKILKSFNEIKENLVNKESANSLKFLRNRIKTWLNSPRSIEHVVPINHYFNFNFSIFRSTLFYRTGKLNIQFSDFTECRSEILLQNTDNISQLTNCDDYSMQNYCSVLAHFNSYRFASHQTNDLSSDCWSNALNPNECLCIYDLFGVCNDSKCQYQHQKDYIYDSNEKIIDVLTYLPQLSENLNLEQYKSDPKKLKNVLVKYVQDKLAQSDKKATIETICKELSNEIKSQSKTSVSSFLIRSIPKELVNFSENVPNQNQLVPFDDYIYHFDMKDEFFVLKLSKILDLRINNDPDFYLKNRFFAPEGLPISAQLESSLSTDPHNIQMWINLAYHYLGKYDKNENDILHCIDSALNVLSRALQANQTNAELYEQYLFFYSNKMDLVSLTKQSTKVPNLIDIKRICEKILKLCSTYRLWTCYLNLSQKLEEKEKVTMEIIEHFVNDKIRYDNIEQRSLDILEIVFYKINLLVHLNKHEEAVNFFNDIFKDYRTTDGLVAQLCPLITKKHRVFAWLCYIHLILYRSLPYHCFQICRKSTFLQLIDTSPFLFDWNSISSEKDVRLIEKILIRALKNCCCFEEGELDLLNSCVGDDLSSHTFCLPLRINLAQLNKLILSYGRQNGTISKEEDSANSFHFLSIFYSKNYEILSHLHTLQIFGMNLQDDIAENSTGSNSLDMIESFHNSYNQDKISEIIEADQQLTDELFTVLKHQLKLNYWLALYQMKFNNVANCKQILIKSLLFYFKNDIPDLVNDDKRTLQLFETILFHDQCDHSREFSFDSDHMDNLKFRNDKRVLKCVYLYLSYLMYLSLNHQMNGFNYDEYFLKLDCVFTSVINSFSSTNQTNPNNEDYKILWINYLLFLMEFPFNESHFKFVYDNFRHICVTFNSSDPMFIYHLTNAFSRLIVPNDRLYFLIEISKLNPDNSNLLITVINLALQELKKETCWNFITHMVYEKKIRLQCFEFWKIAISLSIERNDHLNTHKFFQISISLMPFNVSLWEMVMPIVCCGDPLLIIDLIENKLLSFILNSSPSLAQKLRNKHQPPGASQSFEAILSQYNLYETQIVRFLINYSKTSFS